MRKKKPSQKALQATVISFVLLGMVAMAPAGWPANGKATELETLAQGETGQIITDTDWVFVVGTSKELKELYSSLDIEENPPDLDMDAVTVIAAIGGPRPTSGYRVAISSVYANDESSAVVEVLETVPVRPCSPLPVEVTPYHIVATPFRLEGRQIQIQWSKTLGDCP